MYSSNIIFKGTYYSELYGQPKHNRTAHRCEMYKLDQSHFLNLCNRLLIVVESDNYNFKFCYCTRSNNKQGTLHKRQNVGLLAEYLLPAHRLRMVNLGSNNVMRF